MACKGCTCSTSSSKAAGDTVAGCGSNGCSTGGCNRMNTFDWLTALDIEDQYHFDIVEISFKNGSRKEFFKNPIHTRCITGDMVLVESDNGGYDLGRVSLSGELVRVQMKKRNVKEKTVLQSVIRRANERDLERLQEAREAEKPTMVLARAIARTLSLDMKVSDVEYQGDKRKATFYYTADGRVDFRELIREFAREFKVKIEMRQIGARQESARIGGLGPCGRELCCSTWLTDFKSVSTVAARYQNLAINQSKLSGQCGRLKCCLNFELDTYMDALEQFPSNADRISTEEGGANLMKTDIFKGLMYYCYEKDRGRGKFYPLDIEQVKEVLEANKIGVKPQDLASLQVIEEEDEDVGFDGDLTGVVELPSEQKRKKKKNNRSRKDESNDKLPAFRRRDSSDDKVAAGTEAKPKNNDKREDRREDKNRQPRRENNEQRPQNTNDRTQRPNNTNNKSPRAEHSNGESKEGTNENKNQNTPNLNRNNNNKQRPPRPERSNDENKNENKNQNAPNPNNNNNNNKQRPPRPERSNDENKESGNVENKNNRPPNNERREPRPIQNTPKSDAPNPITPGETPQNTNNKSRNNKNRYKNKSNKPPNSGAGNTPPPNV
jgi:cell fate regulator YaaT (PSP1 superfamily)